MAGNSSSFDYCAEPDLLCDEETNVSLCFDADASQPSDHLHLPNVVPESGPSILSPCLSEESVAWMVERENLHLPRNDYLKRLRSGDLDLSFRREALDWIFKASSHHSFGELCLYLASNYLDRFLSVYSLPKGKVWAVQLVAVSCLSLAAKIDEVNVPLMVDLQAGEPKYLFEGKTIQRMEMLILSYLNWNMKSYTPLDYIDYYLAKVNSADHRCPNGSLSLLQRSTQIILSTVKGIDFLEFKPSEIAAAVAVHVSRERRAIDIDKALSSFLQVEKARVGKCLELIQDLISTRMTMTSSTTTMTTITTTGEGSISISPRTVPCSPNGVLDAAFYSYENGERTVGSCPSPSSSHNAKRRKLEEEEDHTTKALSGDS
ncbi:cyclin-D4-2-like [Andrographis paniculata]|uniref:cyclin-D4-2-like n=1 Tax=Andrographis paniculata TaxID=175694 RepID=UPI0021E95566|nr:cyclin-D4-2-like [Andrographis paniculata]